jgi:hypothetical protein
MLFISGLNEDPLLFTMEKMTGHKMKKNQGFYRIGWAYPALLIFFILGTCAPALANKGIYDWAFVRLDYVRDDKEIQLKGLCDSIHNLALKASGDKLMAASFDINMQYSEAEKQGPVPEALAEKVSELRKDFQKYYIENYFAFFDILFVNMKGEVFYTIRKEADLNLNIFDNNTGHKPLFKGLKTVPQKEAFIDFHEYEPSSRPAAFFVEPVFNEGGQIGCIFLQWAINKVNSLFTWADDTAETGETFLVNHDGYMLTESNFQGSSTVLNKRLDDRNIKVKFADEKGHRTVTDYRGCIALTSFEVFEFMGIRWLVVAKVDRDEIITRHYIQYQRYYADRLMTFLKTAPPAALREPRHFDVKVSLRTDMDEFMKATHGERLHTFGISTCTGLLAAYPGRFAYLAHISPKDKVYGAQGTNLLGLMVKKIKKFDVYPYERRSVVFVYAATHLDSLRAIVDKLLEEGFMLSQINVLYNPRAESASITYDYVHDELDVAWRMDRGLNSKNAYLIEDAYNMGKIIQSIMDSGEKKTGEIPG